MMSKELVQAQMIM